MIKMKSKQVRKSRKKSPQRVSKILKRNNFRVKENIKDFNNNIRCLIAVLNKYE